jgi:hypothetical protein
MRSFRVPDRGSVNPTPLGGWDRGASKVEWLDEAYNRGGHTVWASIWGRVTGLPAAET